MTDGDDGKMMMGRRDQEGSSAKIPITCSHACRLSSSSFVWGPPRILYANVCYFSSMPFFFIDEIGFERMGEGA